MFNFSSLVVVLLHGKKMKAPFFYSSHFEIYNLLTRVMFLGEKHSRFFSACHRPTLAICCNLSLMPGNSPLRWHRMCFSFLLGRSLPNSIWHVKKRITSSRHWPHRHSYLIQVSNKSQIIGLWILPSYGFSVKAILHSALLDMSVLIAVMVRDKNMFFRNHVLKLIKYQMTFVLWRNLYLTFWQLWQWQEKLRFIKQTQLPFTQKTMENKPCAI